MLNFFKSAIGCLLLCAAFWGLIFLVVLIVDGVS